MKLLRFLIPALIAIGVLTTLALHRAGHHPSGFSTSSFSVGSPPDRSAGYAKPTHSESRRIDQINRYVRLGKESEDAGKFSLAEYYFKNVCLLDHASFRHLNLALLYDHVGQEKAAMEQYREVLFGNVGWSSIRTDPRVLTHYGDLCVTQGKLTDAKIVYSQAFNTDQSIGPTEPRPFATGSGLNALRAGAHLASAVEYGAVGEKQKQLAEIETALKADGTNWAIRFYHSRELARHGHLVEAKQEALAAERLAPKKAVAKVRDMRRIQGIF